MREATSRVSSHMSWLQYTGVDITSLAGWPEGENREGLERRYFVHPAFESLFHKSALACPACERYLSEAQDMASHFSDTLTSNSKEEFHADMRPAHIERLVSQQGTPKAAVADDTIDHRTLWQVSHGFFLNLH